MVKIEIDSELCIGSGDCGRAAPAAFVLDEDQGVSVVRPGAETVELASLLRAARGCPTQAIRVLLSHTQGLEAGSGQDA